MAPKPTGQPAAKTAKKPTTQPSKKKQPASVETSQSIEEQTKAFFKAGGKVDEIRTGVSGQQGLAGPRHISLGTSNTTTPAATSATTSADTTTAAPATAASKP
jgi:hypothetical protein